MNKPAPTVTDDALIRLVVDEARLIDERRFDEWLDFFAEDGRYWIPLMHDQKDAVGHNSLMHEDRLLLRLRIERLKHARAFSQQPASRCLHVLQQPTVERCDLNRGEFLIRTNYTYLEIRQEDQIVLGATAWHTLKDEGQGRLKIKQKRINLLSCETSLPSVQLFL